jgi:hypothetical protein
LRLPEPWLSFLSLDGIAMRTSFTPAEICEMTAKDLATLRVDFASHPNKAWVDRLAAITENLHTLASQVDRDSVAVTELEQRISAFLAEDKRNKGMTPYLYMVRSLKPGGSPTF